MQAGGYVVDERLTLAFVIGDEELETAREGSEQLIDVRSRKMVAELKAHKTAALERMDAFAGGRLGSGRTVNLLPRVAEAHKCR